jgi:hypothetical protein
MESKVLTRKIQKAISVLYGLIGMFFVYGISRQLWNEGILGNRPFEGCIFAPLGAQTGLLWLLAASSLLIGQVLVFFNNKLGIHFSRASFLLGTFTLVSIYLIFQRWYVWSYAIDFSILLFLLVLFYLPVVSSIRKS